MSSTLIARTSVGTPAAAVGIWKDENGDLSIQITGIGKNWYGSIDLGPAAVIEPGPEHPWIRNRVCEALYSAMGRYGLDKYTKMLISISPGWHEVRQLANAELAGDREIPE